MAEDDQHLFEDDRDRDRWQRARLARSPISMDKPALVHIRGGIYHCADGLDRDRYGCRLTEKDAAALHKAQDKRDRRAGRAGVKP